MKKYMFIMVSLLMICLFTACGNKINDTEAPTITLKESTITLNVGDTFDADEWINNNVSFADNISTDLSYIIEENTVDTSTAAEQHIVISCCDDAGNMTSASITVVVEQALSPVQTSYETAMNLKISDLVKEDDGSYSYGDIIIPQEETDWLSTVKVTDDTQLDSGVLYRTYGNYLEAFYNVFGESRYSSWKTIGEQIFNFDLPSSWSEMLPYVDDTLTYISKYNTVGEMMRRFSLSQNVIGDFNFPDAKFDFEITDLSALADELNINESILGYCLASLEEYSCEIEFAGNSCDVSFELSSSNSVTPDEMNSYSDWTEENGAVSTDSLYCYYGRTSVEDTDVIGFYTYRHEKFGTSISAVIFNHGGGEVHPFDPDTEEWFNIMDFSEDGNTYVLKDNACSYIDYIVNGNYRNRYYFDKDGKLFFIMYSNETEISLDEIYGSVIDCREMGYEYASQME